MVAMLVAGIITVIMVIVGLKKQIVAKKQIITAAIVGLIIGMVLDYFAGYLLGLWSYLRHPYWEISYWQVLPAMWALFGVGTYILWRALKPSWVAIPISMLAYELYGIIRHSWTYTVDWWLVIIGWVPLCIVIVLSVDYISSIRGNYEY